MAEFKFTSQVVEVSFVAAADPTMRVVTELVTAPVSGGGGGAGDVVGPSSSTDGRPVVFDGTSGKKVKQGAVNSPGGLLVLNEDGVVPESRIGTNIVRESEMATAISDAIDAIPTPVWPVDSTPSVFPPEAHEHGIGDLTTTELSTAKVLTPDGSGGVAWGTVSGGGAAFAVRTPSGRYLNPATSFITTQALVVERVYFIPVFVSVEQAFDAIGITVTTAETGALLNLAVYSDTGGGYPGALLVVAGNVDAGSTGQKAAAFTATTLTPGTYWLATRVAASPANEFRVPVSSNAINGAPLQFIGHQNSPGGDTAFYRSGYYNTSPYESMPATAPAMTWTRYIPCPGLRAA